MRIAIHQPHYFPWIGYFDKMAKSDGFVLLDEVQLEKGSPMVRNRVLDQAGEIKFLTISGDTKDFLNRKYSELPTKDVQQWTQRQINALQNYYRKAKYNKEMFPVMENFFKQEHETICQWVCASIVFVRELLDIKTPLIYQSDVNYDRQCRRSDLVYAICKALGADTYFSGRGASVEYLDREKFSENGVNIVFQDFTHPVYSQCGREAFVPGVSILDMLFNCGIEQTRQMFWEQVNAGEEQQ